jgi:MFS family permease
MMRPAMPASPHAHPAAGGATTEKSTDGVAAAAFSSSSVPRRVAALSLLLLLGINLFNYVDRMLLSAVERNIRQDVLHEPTAAADAQAPSTSSSSHAKTRTGMLGSAFIVAYMITAPLFGWLADHRARWPIVGVSVILWSLASGASGLAGAFWPLLVTRLFVGVGEAGYGPAAPTMIADLYAVERRGAAMAWFYMAIPVGSALGYVLAGVITKLSGGHWRWSFYAVVPPGLLLGALCFLMPEPPRRREPAAPAQRRVTLKQYLGFFAVRSYLLDTAGMIALAFAIYGISFYMPGYLSDSHAAADPNAATFFFGVILLVAGVSATLAGGFTGDFLQQHWHGAYFIVSAIGIFLSVIFILLMLFSRFPLAWVWLFWAAFFLFFCTGPSNTILANVIRPSTRAAAFGLNILLIHLLGDVLSPPLMGSLVDHYRSWRPAFYLVCVMMTGGGFLWLWGAHHLAADTHRASEGLDASPAAAAR